MKTLYVDQRPLWPLRDRLRPVAARLARVQGPRGFSPGAGELGVLILHNGVRVVPMAVITPATP